MSTIRDYNGQALTEGAHVRAWLDGVRYTATVKEINSQGPAGYHSITLVRDDDQTEVHTFSDAVAIIRQAGNGTEGKDQR